jgi:predicted phosphodiesterase
MRRESYTYAGTKYIVVGDIHGDFDTFMKFLAGIPGVTLRKNKIIVDEPSQSYKIILVGDYIDKGSFAQIQRTIDFLYENKEHFLICMGNHEYWVMDLLLGNVKVSEAVLEQMSSWFKTAFLLFQDEVLRNKFFKLFDETYHHIETNEANITHAPCKNEFIGKWDKVSLKHQRNLRYPKILECTTEEEYLKIREEFFQFLVDEANDNDKYHIFGHTMVSEIFKYKNKICLDTGSVVGNKLSTAWFEEGKMTLKSYDSTMPKKESLHPYFRNEPKPLLKTETV